MSKPTQKPFPTEPEPRVKRPEFPEVMEEQDTVTIFGYIGEVTHDSIHFHQMFDHRAYYDIPKAGIADWSYDTEPGFPNLVKLVLYPKTPIHYYFATTVKLTAGKLKHAIDTHNTHGKYGPIVTDGVCPITCPPDWCRNGQCIPPNPGFPIDDDYVEMFGLEIDAPEYP